MALGTDRTGVILRDWTETDGIILDAGYEDGDFLTWQLSPDTGEVKGRDVWQKVTYPSAVQSTIDQIKTFNSTTDQIFVSPDQQWVAWQQSVDIMFDDLLLKKVGGYEAPYSLLADDKPKLFTGIAAGHLYYNGIAFDCPHTLAPTPTDYRFNILAMTVTDRNGSRPPLWQPGSWQEVGLILQNTGQFSWELTPLGDCTPAGYPQRTIALSTHWYYPDGNVVEFESNRAVLCQEEIKGTPRTSVAPTELYPAQSEGVTYFWTKVWVPNTLSPALYQVGLIWN